MQWSWIALVPLAIGINYLSKLLRSRNESQPCHGKGDEAEGDGLLVPDLWGTYRSNLYFGMRTKTPQALMTGLAWNSLNDVASLSKMRHSCELDDNVHFGWVEHDGRGYGHQKIVDRDHHSQLDIVYAKERGAGANADETWMVQIRGKPTDETRRLSLIYYVGYDGEQSPGLERLETEEYLCLKGQTPETGPFVIAFRKEKHVTPVVLNRRVEQSRVWAVSDHFLQRMKRNLQAAFSRADDMFSVNLEQAVSLHGDDADADDDMSGANVVAVQFIVSNQFSLDIVYFPLNATMAMPDAQRLAEAAKKTLVALQAARDCKKARLQSRIESRLLPDKTAASKKLLPFVKHALGSLLGGISYFHGDSFVYEFFHDGEQRKKKAVRTAVSELFTDVPARANFPRGFVWDTGFHNLLIARWDMALSLEILMHWVRKIDEDGWIGREQILGAEARSKVPQPYVTQNPGFSNPPALLLPMEMMARSCGALPTQQKKFVSDALRDMYPHLKRHFAWFMRHQRGSLADSEADAPPFLFRWRGRSRHHTLTSGLDDYPRGDTPSSQELHVDLLSWMAFAARAMQEIQEQITSIHDDDTDYGALYREALANLEKYHWDDERRCYGDRTVDERSGQLVFVPNKGYISIFPMLFGLVDGNSDRLGHLLNLIEDPAQLWTRCGVENVAGDVSHVCFV